MKKNNFDILSVAMGYHPNIYKKNIIFASETGQNEKKKKKREKKKQEFHRKT